MADDLATIGYKADLTGINKLNKGLDSVGTKSTKTAKTMTNSMGKIGKSAGQAGIQVQQFVGQVQMGTNPMTALSQQAADLGFVLGVPLVGAIAGIAASIGAVLLPSLFDSDSAMEKLEDTVKSLDKTMSIASNGTMMLSTEIANLARVSEGAANAQIALSITEATQALDLARDSADEFLNGFGSSVTEKTIADLDETLKRTGLSTVELFENTDLYATKVISLGKWVKDLNEDFGTTTESSTSLLRAMAAFNDGGSVSDLAGSFTDISLSTKGATKEFQEVVVNLNKLALTSEKSENVLRLLEGAFGDLDSILSQSATAANSLAESYQNKTYILNKDAKQMEINAAVQALGADATMEEYEAVINAVKAYHQKVDAINQEIKAEKDAKSARESAAREQDRFVTSLVDAIDPSASLAREIQMVNDALSDGAITSEQAARRLSQLNMQLHDMNNVGIGDLASQYATYGEAVSKIPSIQDDLTNSYMEWIEATKSTANPIAELIEEIEKVKAALEMGDLDEATALKRIEQIREQINEINEIKNPYEDLTSGAAEYLAAIQSLTENGSDSYRNLTAAIQAAATAQAFLSGNYLSGFASSVSILSSFGGEDFEDASIARQLEQGVSDWNEKASSIDDSVSAMERNTDDLVGINTDMLAALENLQTSLMAASGIVARDVTTPTANPSFESNALDYFGWQGFTDIFGQNFITEALDFLSLDFVFDAIGDWLGGSSKIIDEGINIMGGTLGDLMDEVTVSAFQEVSYKKWRFGSSKTKKVTEDISDQVGSQFELVFNSLADAVFSGATALGMDEGDVTDLINSFVIDTIDVSLKDLSVDEQAAALEDIFSDVFNDLTVAVMPWLDELQQTGEELGETLSRVATEVAIADLLVSQIGISFGELAGKDFAIAADNLANLVGGVEGLADATGSFINSFASDETKLSILDDALSDAFSAVGLALPTTTEEMWNLMSSLDASTEAGQQQVAALLNNQDAAAEYFSLLEDQQEAATKAAEDAAAASEKAAAEAKAEAEALESSLESLSNSFASAVLGIYDLGEAAQSMTLDAALSAARAGDFSLAESLDPNSFNLDESAFSSASAYNLAQASSANKLLEISELAANQTSVEEEQLSVLMKINENIVASYSPSNAKDTAIGNEMSSQSETMKSQSDMIEANLVQSVKINTTLDRIARVGIPIYE